MSVSYHITPGGQLSGAIRPPGDKSISHRSIMLGAIAEGVTQASGFLEGADALATMQAFREMGVRILGPTAGEVEIFGVGLHGLKSAPSSLDMGNSGTAMRLLAGLLAGQPFTSELTGDESLRQRPMRRVALPLEQMGAKILTAEGGRPPIKIIGNPQLKGIRYAMPIASAQVKSALLLAGLYAHGETCVEEPAPTRDHTERMLLAFQYQVDQTARTSCLTGGGSLQATEIKIPADISSAAFFMVGASIAPGSDVILQEVGVNPTRVGVIDILRKMGADITLLNPRVFGGEPVADIRVRHAKLKGIVIPEALVPLAIDEFPAIFVAAANAEGETVLSGAEELRVKESDRIQVMADGLTALGVAAVATADGMVIRGGAYGGATINSRGDHRIAMAFSIAGLTATGPIVVTDCANVATSFPGFASLAANAGLKIATA